VEDFDKDQEEVLVGSSSLEEDSGQEEEVVARNSVGFHFEEIANSAQVPISMVVVVVEVQKELLDC